MGSTMLAVSLISLISLIYLISLKPRHPISCQSGADVVPTRESHQWETYLSPLVALIEAPQMRRYHKKLLKSACPVKGYSVLLRRIIECIDFDGICAIAIGLDSHSTLV